MGLGDKIRDKVEELSDNKPGVGETTERDVTTEGRVEQTDTSTTPGGGSITDALRDAGTATKGDGDDIRRV